jgi:hypothetical protein
MTVGNYSEYPAIFILRVWLMAILVLTLWLATPQPVHADVAPPENPPGANPQPGSQTTQVRMQAETVVMVVRSQSVNSSPAQAEVSADFTMHNLGSTDEHLDVRFPLSFWDGESDGFGNFPEIPDLTASVDGRSVTTQRVLFAAKDGTSIPWAVFSVTFPAGKDVHIQVKYTQDGYGYSPYVAFRYILETGAGWKDTIGSADLIVRLPYDANDVNVVIYDFTGFSGATRNFTLAGKELRWHYDNLEPTTENNLSVSLVIPEVWQSVLKEKTNLANHPGDGESWGRLAKIYKELSLEKHGAMRSDPTALKLYSLSLEAYEKCLQLLPKDGLWHAGLADLLWLHYYYNVYFMGINDTSELERSLQEIQLSNQYAPDNDVAKNLMDEINYDLPGAISAQNGHYTILALIAPVIETPTEIIPEPTNTRPAATQVKTASTIKRTPTAHANLQPVVTKQNTPAPTKKPAPHLPLCGAALLPLLFLLSFKLWQWIRS